MSSIPSNGNVNLKKGLELVTGRSTGGLSLISTDALTYASGIIANAWAHYGFSATEQVPKTSLATVVAVDTELATGIPTIQWKENIANDDMLISSNESLNLLEASNRDPKTYLGYLKGHFDNYDLDVSLSSDNVDDDSIGVIIAFESINDVDQYGPRYEAEKYWYISVKRNQGGGQENSGELLKIEYRDYTGITKLIHAAGVNEGLTQTIYVSGDDSKQGWKSYGPVRLKVMRRGDKFMIQTANNASVNWVYSYEFDLKDLIGLVNNEAYENLTGRRRYGFMSHSQPNATIEILNAPMHPVRRTNPTPQYPNTTVHSFLLYLTDIVQDTLDVLDTAANALPELTPESAIRSYRRDGAEILFAIKTVEQGIHDHEMFAFDPKTKEISKLSTLGEIPPVDSFWINDRRDTAFLKVDSDIDVDMDSGKYIEVLRADAVDFTDENFIVILNNNEIQRTTRLNLLKGTSPIFVGHIDPNDIPTDATEVAITTMVPPDTKGYSYSIEYDVPYGLVYVVFVKSPTSSKLHTYVKNGTYLSTLSKLKTVDVTGNSINRQISLGNLSGESLSNDRRSINFLKVNDYYTMPVRLSSVYGKNNELIFTWPNDAQMLGLDTEGTINVYNLLRAKYPGITFDGGYGSNYTIRPKYDVRFLIYDSVVADKNKPGIIIGGLDYVNNLIVDLGSVSFIWGSAGQGADAEWLFKSGYLGTSPGSGLDGQDGSPGIDISARPRGTRTEIRIGSSSRVYGGGGGGGAGGISITKVWSSSGIISNWSTCKGDGVGGGGGAGAQSAPGENHNDSALSVSFSRNPAAGTLSYSGGQSGHVTGYGRSAYSGAGGGQSEVAGSNGRLYNGLDGGRGTHRAMDGNQNNYVNNNATPAISEPFYSEGGKGAPAIDTAGNYGDIVITYD